MRPILLCSYLLTVYALTLVPTARAEDLMELPLGDLMKMTVTTASKEEQTVAEATSVVTVIGRHEIESSGVLTLNELMRRVPGYFPSQQPTWSFVTSRGLPSDGNDHFLLLVDGHPQNSIIGQGFQQQDLIPTLDKVERIEIIRGPGSVLWGSSAALGIINMITRDWIEKPKLTVVGQTEPKLQPGANLQTVNYTAGIGDGKDLRGIYSLSLWRATGYRYTKNGENAVAFPWGSKTSDTWFVDWPEIGRQRDGFEFYSKVKYKDDTELYARLLKTSFNYTWDEWSSTTHQSKHELGNRRAYVGVRRKLISDGSFRLEANAYGDYNLQNRDPLEIDDTDYTTRAQDKTNEEFALGAELTATWQPIQKNTLKIGTKYVRTVVGPNRDTLFNPITNTPISSGSETADSGSTFTYNVPFFGIDPGIDNLVALYAEDSHKLGPATIFAGARFDWNDYRETGGKLLPRAGLVYHLSDDLVAKYTFNTGYLRPNAAYSKARGIVVDKTRGGAFPITRIGSSERVNSHDVQLSYSNSVGGAAATFFFMQIDDFVSFDATSAAQGYKNIGDARSIGVELEGKRSLGKSVVVYGNSSYAKGHINDATYSGILTDDHGTTLNYPQLMANLGFDLNWRQDHLLNVNGRAWAFMRYKKGKDERNAGDPDTVFATLPARAYLDLNYTIKNLIFRDFDLNVFAFNALNNQEKIGMVVNNGTYRPLGRTVGLRVSYDF